ncbi:Ribosomal protein Rsm22 bacterial-type [Penicillium coprophilum]|uniref:Ribosomal protein Rsm22 bacterial-type n=1 Tax=Penicillium coprophilum TaxID=36646 RepID=UPI0023871ACC|nr:Ribosomal protein Rsm22 bacterial-type [Penicillium coprophilum]KAJ5163692.1 Ribosomal protein Rsm22 bacterial-type [Penicillium coprophilum]
MLSRSSASGASRSQSRELFRTFACPPGSRQLRGPVNRLTPTHQRTLVQKASPLIASSSLAHRRNTSDYATSQSQPQRRFVSGPASADSPTQPSQSIEPDHINTLIDRIGENEAQMAQILGELEILGEEGEADELIELIDQRDEHTAESWVHMIKQRFGDEIPEGLLDDAELQIYARLYGEPIIRQEVESMVEEEEEDMSLLREDGKGGWEEVDLEDSAAEDDVQLVYDMDIPPEERETIAMQRTREVAEQLGGEIMLEEFENEAVPDSAPRMHPLTLEGKFGTDPTTIHLPKDTVTGPISVILSEFSNKHISETARRLFGGPGLPHSSTTAPPRAQLPQLPVALNASQRQMGEMEANAYLAALYPGIYASTLSVMVEIRKRLGVDWIRRLIAQDGGPNVLDASGGGAGILAWRDIIRAEWELMVPDHPSGAPIPYGRSTVLTGSDALRQRASVLLDNTTFLPRLPDYVHVREKPTIDDSRKAPKRKQYDIIIAPHSLLGLEEEYERKQHVENLWSLLNPNGGILILLEKGRQKGFEAISGAREMLLKRHIASPGSTEYDNFLEDPDQREVIEKERGMIVAPCTNHSTCPMHNSSGATKGRRDFCHFEQRYIRPPFLQRIMGAKDRNHEDLKFSYLAVQRGVDLRQDQAIRQDSEATDAAFEGFEDPEESDMPNKPAFHALSLPRAIYPPMKRRGHVIFDLCTPAGKIERWTVPRSYSRQAYRDARKSHWGDLWALGAKTRIPRNLNLGDKHGEGKKERLARRAATKASEEEGEFENEGEEENEEYELHDSDVPDVPVKKRGQHIPSWKKHNDKKKIRQASNKRSADE